VLPLRAIVQFHSRTACDNFAFATRDDLLAIAWIYSWRSVSIL
jgi:hypothetical protein